MSKSQWPQIAKLLSGHGFSLERPSKKLRLTILSSPLGLVRKDDAYDLMISLVDIVYLYQSQSGIFNKI
jgi:hypothetical protein